MQSRRTRWNIELGKQGFDISGAEATPHFIGQTCSIGCRDRRKINPFDGLHGNTRSAVIGQIS